jgi:hypothetical protein
MVEKDRKDAAPEPETATKEETAYEDSWYRSLKAISERPGESDDEQVGTPED